MSFNNNHSNPAFITPDNYEAYFLLYVDDELSAAEKTAVENFAAQHPHLKEELDALCSTKLVAEPVTFDKSGLFASSMQMNSNDEQLLLYIDDELPVWEKQKVAEQLKTDTAFAAQYNVLLKAKLDASETIECPFKEELYHKKDRRILPYWLRIAAAVVVVAGAGTLGWLSMGISKTHTAAPLVATTQPAQQTTPANKPAPQTNTAITTVTDNTTAVADNNNTNEQPVVAATTKKEKPTTTTLPALTHKQQPATNNVPANQLAQVDVPVKKQPDAVAIDNKLPQQIINNKAVTNSIAERTINTDAATTQPDYAALVEPTTSNEKSGSLKGFLRKASRFIERRTGVKSASDDDEILIGAVALKLK